MKLLLATTNPGKVREMQDALGRGGVTVVSLADCDVVLPEETGETFLANARQKALFAARETGLWAVGEDSGLEVRALGGEPGVLSARYAGPGADDGANNKKLLRRMHDVPEGQRQASFRSAMVLADPAGNCHTAMGQCDGIILKAPRGSGGFGYDPLFFIPELGKTFAELTDEEKTRRSHRGEALLGLRPILDTVGLLSYD